MRTLADLYQEYVVALDPILWEMGRVNGIWVDNAARLAVLSEMTGKIDADISEAQQYVPDTLYPRERLKTPPSPEKLEKEHAIRVDPIQVPSETIKTCSRCGAQHVTKVSHTSRRGGRDGVPLNPCYKADIQLRPGVDTEYDVVEPFNPGSDDQLRSYAGLFHHKLGRDWRTGADTLDKAVLQKFIERYGDKHPLYKLASHVREVRKARGYASAWIPDESGRIYGQFKHVPETLRLSQSDHNLMNVSHRDGVEYAEELRQILVAPPGSVIVEGDSSSIEAVFTGKLMGSASYMELARRGIHAWWACKKLGLEPTLENIKFVKNAKEHQQLYETKKRTVHAVSYGMGAKLLHESYPEFFPRVRRLNPRTSREEWCSTCTAQDEIDEFYGLVPDLQEWHNDTRKFAHKHGYLVSPWGFKNYYYRVFTYEWKDKKWKLGEDAKAVVAFQPQHANAMFQRENLKLIHATIDKMGKRGKWLQTAIGHVHDSNGMVVPEDDQDKAKEMLMEIMNRPIKQFDHLQIGVQVKAGKNWAGHDKEDNPMGMKAIGSI